MKRRIALKLARELESGKWKKGKYRLGRGECVRCCLGVLQEIAPKRLKRESLDEGFPSMAVYGWAELSGPETQELVEMNDTARGWGPVIKKLRETP